MKKVSLRNFLIIFFTLLTFIIGGLIISVVVRTNNINKGRALKINQNNAKFAWSVAHQSQYGFFVNYKDDVVFFQTEQSKYIKRSQIYTTKVHNKFDSLKILSVENNFGIEGDLQSFSNELAQIDEVFEQITHLLFIRGSKKTGIIGNCFTLYDLSSTSVSDKNLSSLLDKSHSFFLDYLYNPSFDNYEQFLDVFTMMNSYIRQQNVVRDTGVIDTLQLIPQNVSFSPKFIVYVNDYKQSFSKLVGLDRKLFLNDQANLMNQWSTLNRSFKSKFSESVISINKRVEEEVNTYQRVMIYSVLFIIFILISINFFLPRLVSRRVKELKDFIEPLRTGKIPEYNFKPKAFTEVIEISESMSLIIKSLKDASVFADEIGKGNFNFEFKPISEDDDLGKALILLRDNLAQAQKDEAMRRKEDKVREWVNSGIAKFSDILRQSTKEIRELSAVIIKELVNYLEANQGGIFILNDEKINEKLLDLSASYAYSKERKKKKKFVLGEGLIGTCAVEKETIYMTEIPEDYISITSGLGEANPRSLLITPLKHEDNVLGVIEIASFNTFDKYQIEFVEKIAESIASTISITKINERTARLLENAKIEAEQRSLKEEELKQNLEELEATQERASHRETELNNLIGLINQVAYIIELDVSGNIITVPDSMQEKFDIESSMIIGHHFSEFDANENSILKKDEFWTDLLKEKEQQYNRKFVNKGEVYWFNDYIIPFINIYNEVEKLICVSFDITNKEEEKVKLQELTNSLISKEKEISQKVDEIEKAKSYAEDEKKEAQGIAQKLKVSEEILKRAIKKNEDFVEKIKKEAEQTVNQSKRYKILFDSTFDAVQLIVDGKYEDCNLSTLKMFGYEKKEDFLNLQPYDISPEFQEDKQSSKDKANEMMSIAIEQGKHQFDWTHKRADGTNFPVEVTLVSFKLDKKIFIYALLRDLTKIEKANNSEEYLIEKYKKRARKFREKLEKFDIELEQKEAEIYILKNQIEKMKK